jgi:hypothetical protein
MKPYRAFALTADGHAKSCVDLYCVDEREAIGRARKMLNDDPIELWEAAHRIGRFEPGKLEQVANGRPPGSRPQ